MKLYYSPGACSLSPHIVLNETGLPYEAVLASTKTKKLQDGTDYYTINSKGYVPTLELDDGTRLTEARRSSSTSPTRCPRRSSRRPPARCRATGCRSGSTSSPASCTRGSAACSTRRCPKEAKALMREKATSRLKWVDAQLEGKDYTMGNAFSVADAYLFVVSQLDRPPRHRHLVDEEPGAFMERMRARPAVQAAMKAEGLLK
jgi:glutathione S-transferase